MDTLGYIGIHWPPPWIHWDTLATSMIHWNTPVSPMDTSVTPWTHWNTPASPLDTLGHTGHAHGYMGPHQPSHRHTGTHQDSPPHGCTKPHQSPPWTHKATPATPTNTLGHTSHPEGHTRPHTNLAAHIFTKESSFSEQNCNLTPKCPKACCQLLLGRIYCVFIL